MSTVLLASACGGDDPAKGGTDSQPPVFAGLSQAMVLDDGDVELTWEPATDDVTRPSRIVYAIYAASREGGHDFTKPFGYTPAGATGAVLHGLVPSQDFYWVVRAVDEAGNQDDNVVELPATPLDGVPPRFAGVVNATALTSRSLLVEWKPGRDNATLERDLRYRVYVSSSPSIDTFTFDEPHGESEPGQSSMILDGFDPLTEYFVVVRAVDRSGLEDSNTFVRAVKTPEGIPPVFAGIKQANPLPTGVKLYWLPAQDNATEAANIVYNIHVSTTEMFSSEALSKPAFTTEPAALSFTVPGLQAGRRYFFIVRARDTAGNTDANTNYATVTAISGKDSAAPDFDGVKEVVSESPTTLRVSWDPATDDVTPASRIVYDVFVQDQPGGPPVVNPKPTVVSRPGATSATITGLPPQATRWVVVRARDEAGNSLPNNIELSGTTLERTANDLVAPVWDDPGLVVEMPGVDSTEMGRPYKLLLSWQPATDNVSAATDIRYHVCAEPQQADCLGSAFNRHIRASSPYGATNMVVGGLTSRTRYFVYLRAEDRAGNIETGLHGTSRTTATSFMYDVQPILNDKCNGCHSFALGTMVDVPGGYADPRLPATESGLKLVDPGKPELSLIYRRINPRGLALAPFSASFPNLYAESSIQEPRDGAGTRTVPLSGAEDGAIRDWILQGAKGD